MPGYLLILLITLVTLEDVLRGSPRRAVSRRGVTVTVGAPASAIRAVRVASWVVGFAFLASLPLIFVGGR